MAITYSFTGLPAGMKGNPNGQINGTPTAYGNFNVGVTADNGFTKTTKSFPLKIWQKSAIAYRQITCPAFTSPTAGIHSAGQLMYTFAADVDGQYMASGSGTSPLCAMRSGDKLYVYAWAGKYSDGRLYRGLSIQSTIYIESGGKRIVLPGERPGLWEVVRLGTESVPYLNIFSSWRPPSFNY